MKTKMPLPDHEKCPYCNSDDTTIVHRKSREWGSEPIPRTIHRCRGCNKEWYHGRPYLTDDENQGARWTTYALDLPLLP